MKLSAAQQLERGGLVVAVVALVVVAGCTPPSAGSATTTQAAPWLGVPLTPGLTPHTLQVEVTREPAPAVVPAGEERFTELAGSRMAADLEEIVEISIQSRASREFGDGQLWGRVTGFASGRRVIEWAAEQFREAGLEGQVQEFAQNADATLRLPMSWEVRLLADPAFGAGSQDVVLESAMPLSPVNTPAEGLTAPLVYVGDASPAILDVIDVRGKVAVQSAAPQGHTVFLRGRVGPRAEDLLARGAVAVLTILEMPGNMRARDMGCGGGMCFNLGGQDGHFITSFLSAASEAGIGQAPQVRIQVESQEFTGLSGQNAVAIVRGRSRPEEYIIVNAHADGWFDAAGDNGDGLAVLVALARHFARPEMQPERSIVFVASAGHHSSGLTGPAKFVEMNPEIVRNTVLTINLEHTAQRHITPAREYHEDGSQKWVMDSHESPIVAAFPDGRPFLEELLQRGIQRYGTNFVSDHNTAACGDCGSYRATGATVLTTMQGPPMYHTTGEVLQMVSVPGMERMARFMAFFLKEADRADASALSPVTE